MRAISCAHSLTWHIWCQEQKLLIRECSHEVFFFFLFVHLDKSTISSLVTRSPGAAQFCSYLSLPIPSPPRDPRGSPRPHTPVLCHCSPDKRPSGSSSWASGPFSKWAATMRTDICSFCCFVFSQHSNRERSQDQLTNRYKAKRQRDSDLEAGHQKDGVRMGECPRWQGP